MATPLEGIKVLDLTRYQSGPACTVMLADLGADVLKVEIPGRGDEGRKVFPVKGQKINPYFLVMNRGKRGLGVNYRKPEGRELLLRLGETCDVVVENFRPGAAAAQGLGFEHFKARNPRIVFASISAFGARGPMGDHAGFDIHGQAMGGLVSTTGNEGDAYPVGAAIGDQMAGLTLVTGVLAALLAAARTGEGQEVGASLYGSQLALQAWEIGHYAMSGIWRGKAGTNHPIIRTAGNVWGTYATRDGHIALGVLGDEQWRKFAAVIGLELEEEEEGGEFMRNVSHLDGEIRERLKTRDTAEWLRLLQAEDIHVGKVNDYADILADPQAWANDYFVEVEQPDGSRYELVGSPLQFSATPAHVHHSSPGLGEHTEVILREFGLSDDEISALRNEEVI